MLNKCIVVIHILNESRHFRTHSVNGFERYFLMAVQKKENKEPMFAGNCI